MWPLCGPPRQTFPNCCRSLTQRCALCISESDAPEVIIQNVCRFGLYADEIFLVDPFDNPNIIGEDSNPVLYPEEWIEETLRMLYQLMAMAPWVDKGFVTFIPNPGEFDRSLLLDTVKLAEKRLRENPITAQDVDESTLKQKR